MASRQSRIHISLFSKDFLLSQRKELTRAKFYFIDAASFHPIHRQDSTLNCLQQLQGNTMLQYKISHISRQTFVKTYSC